MGIRDSLRKVVLSDLALGTNILATVAAVLVPTALRWLFGHNINPVPFVTYFPVVLLAAVLLGWRWAAIATIASAIIVNRLFLAKPWLEGAHPPEIAVFVFFVLSCSFLIFMGDALRRTVRQLDRHAREREVLLHEMYHRVQNTCSVIQAMIRMAGSTDLDQYRRELLDRVQALSEANRILQAEAESDTSVRQLIEQAIAPFSGDDRFLIEGPDRALPPNAGRQLLLILHELCTNALKHGALSLPQGRVAILWTNGQEPLRVEWRESGGPPVEPPSRIGLGTRLMKAQGAFAATTTYEPQGVVCTLELAPPGSN
jgi:two-component sensor histidine kinase